MSADDQDEPYLWDRSPPGDNEVERLERALAPLRHRAPLDLGALPDRAPEAAPSRDNVVPLRRRALSVSPVTLGNGSPGRGP